MHRRSKKILIIIGGIAIAFGVLYAVALVRATMKLRRTYAALAADGRPMQAADVIPRKVPDAQNAALLYQSAALMLKGQAAGESNLLEHLARLYESLFQKLDDPDKIARQQRDIAELRQWMGQEVVVSALSALEQGTRRPTCQFDREYAGGLSSDMPFEQDLRRLARVLGARACFEAEAGQLSKAWASVQTLLTFADALRNDPMTMCQWTRLGTIRRACSVIQTLCETAPPDTETARRIDTLLKDSTDIRPLVRALDGERLLIGEWFFNLPNEEMAQAWRKAKVIQSAYTSEAFQEALDRLGFRILAFRPRLVADHAAYLQMMRRRVELMQDPYRDRNENRGYPKPSVWNFLAYELAQGGGNEKSVHCRMATAVQLTRAGLALLQYRQAHGALPPTLEALGLEELIDPYTEKPLGYRAEDEGFVVYSAGEDRKDNGGTPEPEKRDSDPRRRQKKMEYDEVWRFPNAKNRIALSGR